ncbi:MAG: glucosidase [Edaphobacter sp.]|uniref:MGH1-like glycoside hydrolase domain-containing protein n=1 Tax=Edaphobacter sp. TaxID=1934404 RepID=UPI0023932A7D|nr:glucosidase [Edaphobacter sp.]MDE1177815.1 glucosidase [Edaphobacter sp.]
MSQSDLLHEVEGMPVAEHVRLKESKEGSCAWKLWGPYLSERQWGTVREDYSPNGDAWNFFTHDQSRSKAYKWGEDGIAGISDDHQHLCFAIAMWNGADPILKERLFGLTNSEGNHGEDVKEYYFYLDNTPTHSYMKYLYKYPQTAFPYDELVKKNAGRSKFEHEYELIDTGVFEENHYFDVFVEYAKVDADDLLIRITAVNRSDRAAMLHLLPTLWFRNMWWQTEGAERPQLQICADGAGIDAIHERLGTYRLHVEDGTELLFTENESNEARLSGGVNATPYVKDAFHEYVVHGNRDAVNPEHRGTKAAAHSSKRVKAGGEWVMRLRLRRGESAKESLKAAAFDAVFTQRISEADEFYKAICPKNCTAGDATIIRQGLAGMLWSKQFYYFDLDLWLREHGYNPTGMGRQQTMRNAPWFHMLNADVISMPDKWEYPWYAAWDLAFHTVALAMVDVEFAKQQLELMVSETYLHPNGQLPAYEWNFGDVNPPVHAWAVLYVYMTEKSLHGGEGDLEFLRSCFRKLLLNFTWWVNRKDRSGRNIFEGGFLGLDNIGVFDRSAPLPDGGYLEQADGTAWMAMFAQSMLSISLELAASDESYEDVAVKFLEHFLWIAGAMDPQGDSDHELWDDEDGFFYDVLYAPDGTGCRLKLKSMVGLLPLAAVSIMPTEILEKYPRLMERAKNFFKRRPELAANLHEPDAPGEQGRFMLSVLNRDNLKRVLTRMLDEEQFLGEYGIRSISREHLEKPYLFDLDGTQYKVQYEPAESTTGLFGGNSNWRGPVWMPVNALLVKSLLLLYQYYGDSFTVECPTGSGVEKNLFEVAHEIGDRLANIFRVNAEGRRPVYGDTEVFQSDPHWKDLVLFYEYFHGDNGAGIGASHQTGWTGVIARFLHLFDSVTAHDVLYEGTASLLGGDRLAKTEAAVPGKTVR